MEEGLGHPIPGLPNVYGRGPFNISIADTVVVPSDLPAGKYTLSWRWEAEQTKQVWAHCSDVMVVSANASANDPAVEADESNTTAQSVYQRSRTTRHVCTGDSLGLDIYECDSWVDLYDALDGPNWPSSKESNCPDLRTNPCGCNGIWSKYVQCTSFRNILHLSEMYLLGPEVHGVLPNIDAMAQLRVLSLVETKISGTVPDTIGSMPALEMVWLDHNPFLGGALPSSLSKLKLSVLEVHRSNFSGVLPPLDYGSIADCTLNDMQFECPLPEGAAACGAACN
jgi:hypothetical protein